MIPLRQSYNQACTLGSGLTNDVNCAIMIVKTAREHQSLFEKWLDVYYPGLWEQTESSNDGWDIEIDDNQWIVVLRVGTNWEIMDYHFWYRTDMGLWANKHGYNGTPSELLNEMPSDDSSGGVVLQQSVALV